jgi:signal transduction histidine kinase
MREAVRGREAIGVAVVVGVVATVLVVVSPGIPLVFRGPALQAVIETAGGVAPLSAALIVYGRFRADQTLGPAVLFGALVAFGLTNLLLGTVPATFGDIAGSFDTWAAMGARAGCVLAFACAPWVTSRRTVSRALPLLLAILNVAVAALVVQLLGDRLPPPVVLSDTVATVGQLMPHPAVVGFNVFGIACFLTAAVGFARRTDDPFALSLAGAAVLGAFSRLHLALVPSLYSGAVYSGDFFRLAFHTAVLLAAIGEISRYWEDREALAVAEERRRVARELHDGVAQEIAFIATTSTRMQRASADGDGGGDLALIASAARRALDESRRAIATLTRPLDEPLAKALADTLSELANRSGGTVELDLDPDAHVEPAVREELLRIAREAVGNALRHADCERARVLLRQDDRLVLEISDDGCGFDPAQPGNAYGFGLTSMRERTHALGAEFELISHPDDGTTIRVTL